MTLTHDSAIGTEPFRLFHVEVRRTQRLSPSFLRVTFHGEDLHDFADNGFDQRIKLILPLPGRGLTDLPTGPDWYAALRQLPDDRRNPVRTYTARGVRPEQREVDIDMVLHGDGGPASRFALQARPGDQAALLGPNRAFPDIHGGVEFSPPDGYRGPILLAADETAVPAVAGILERLPQDAFGEVVLEVPCADDRLDVAVPDSVNLTWVARDDAPHGVRLVEQVRATVAEIAAPPCVVPTPALSEDLGDAEDVLLWDVPANRVEATPLYAWLAGESSAIKTLRRLLVTELGHDRRTVAFMGYWRLGRPEG